MVYIAVFIEHPTPFLREYFEKILNLNYPKQRLAVFIHNQVRRSFDCETAYYLHGFIRIILISSHRILRVFIQFITVVVKILLDTDADRKERTIFKDESLKEVLLLYRYESNCIELDSDCLIR
jgi:hypothetical protein